MSTELYASSEDQPQASDTPIPSIVITPSSPIVSPDTLTIRHPEDAIDENLNHSHSSPISNLVCPVPCPSPILETKTIDSFPKINSLRHDEDAPSGTRNTPGKETPSLIEKSSRKRKRHHASHSRESSSESLTRAESVSSRKKISKLKKRKGPLDLKATKHQRDNDETRHKPLCTKEHVDHASFKNMRVYIMQALKFGGKGQVNAEKIANHAVNSIRSHSQGCCYPDLRDKFISDFRRGSNGLLMFKETLGMYLASMKPKNRFKCVEGISNFFIQDRQTWQMIEDGDTVRMLSSTKELSQFLLDSREKYHMLREAALYLPSRMSPEISPGSPISPNRLKQSQPVAKRKRTSVLTLDDTDEKDNHELMSEKPEQSSSNTLDVLLTYGRLPQDLKTYLHEIGLPTAQIIGDIIPTIILALSDKCQMSYEDLRDLFIHTMSDLAQQSEPKPPDLEFRLRLSCALASQEFFEFVTNQVTLSMVTEVISLHFKSDANTQEMLQAYNDQQKHVSKLLAQRANTLTFLPDLGS